MPRDYPPCAPRIVYATSPAYSPVGGRQMIEAYEAGTAPAFVSSSGLGLGGTSTCPRCRATSRLTRIRPIFVPSVGNFRQGACWCQIPLHPRRAARRAEGGGYLEEALSRLLRAPAGSSPSCPRLARTGSSRSASTGRTRWNCGVFATEGHAPRPLVARLDNLGKGASGLRRCKNIGADARAGYEPRRTRPFSCRGR